MYLKSMLSKVCLQKVTKLRQGKKSDATSKNQSTAVESSHTVQCLLQSLKQWLGAILPGFKSYLSCLLQELG